MGRQPQGLKVYRWHAVVMQRTLNLGSMRTHEEASVRYGRRICKCKGLSRVIMPAYHGVIVLSHIWDLNDGANVWGFIP